MIKTSQGLIEAFLKTFTEKLSRLGNWPAQLKNLLEATGLHDKIEKDYRNFLVAIVVGQHLFPFRIQKLRPLR